MSKRLLALACLFALAVPVAAQPPKAMPELALQAVPTTAYFFATFKVSKLFDNPAAKPMREWMIAQKELDMVIGMQADEIDRITLFNTSLRTPGIPWEDDTNLMLVSTRKPYDLEKVYKALSAGVTDELLKPKRSGRVAGPFGGRFPKAVFLDQRTIAFLPRNYDPEWQGWDLIVHLMAHRTDGTLARAIEEASKHDIAIGFNVPLLARYLRDGKDLRPEYAPLLLLLKAKSATFTADVDMTVKAKLVMSFPDAETAQQAVPALKAGMNLVASELATEGKPIPQKLAYGWASKALKNAKIEAQGANVVATADEPFKDELASLAAALPKNAKAASDNLKAQLNLRQLGIAVRNHASAFGDLLPGDVEKAHSWSWRVRILPQLEQDQIVQKLDPSKPWDDLRNLIALESVPMPKVFEIPGRPAPKGHTYFRIFSFPKDAKGTDHPLFDEGKRGPKVTDITDGAATTLMIVEAGEAVPWYKPDVLAYDGKLPLPQLGAKDADSFLAVFCDGKVRTLKPSKLGEKTLRALITRAGGETVPDLDKLEK